MSVSKIIVLTCDGMHFDEPNPLRAKRCDATFVGELAEPRDLVVSRAKKAGWSVEGGGAWHYCSRCTQARPTSGADGSQVGARNEPARRCGRCGEQIVHTGMGVWVDATEGDACEEGVHFAVGEGAVPWLVQLDANGEAVCVPCFAAHVNEAGQVAIRVQSEIDADDGGCGERGSYRVVSVARI